MSSYHSEQQTVAELPAPSAQAVSHSSRLIDFIVAEIERHQGVIAFRDYMAHLLYAPGLGYYSAGLDKFGVQGDFVTAPEISTLFGRTLGRQCQQVLAQGCAAQILEFGAGTGKLCAQLFSKLDRLEAYFIMELSADLRERQQSYLKQTLSRECYRRIRWLDRLPAGFSGIVIANEVLDAMPVNLVKKHHHWREIGVGFDGARFVWRDYATESEAVNHIQVIENRLGPLPEGYLTEINTMHRPWLEALQQSCHQALLLLMDYGYEQAQYYHPDRSRGTLQCYYRHRVHDDALLFPGLQDVSAWVDFDAFADAAAGSGFDVLGLVTQAQFLLHNGLLEEVDVVLQGHHDSSAQWALADQVKTLTLPTAMGEKFKVIGLQKNLQLDMPVFGMRV